MEQIDFLYTKYERVKAILAASGLYTPGVGSCLLGAPVWGTQGVIMSLYRPLDYHLALAILCWLFISFNAGAMTYAYRWDPRFSGVTRLSFDSHSIEVNANGVCVKTNALKIFQARSKDYVIAAPGNRAIYIPKRVFESAAQENRFCEIARALWCRYRQQTIATTKGI